MTYEEQLAIEHRQRLARLSRRSPAAGPMKVKPPSKVIFIGVDGRQMKPMTSAPVVARLPPPSRPIGPAKHRDDVPIDAIAQTVARQFGIPESKIREVRSRTVKDLIPRHVAMILATKLTRHSNTAIGRLLGGFDHTTIINACRKWPARVLANPDLGKKTDEIETMLLAAYSPVGDEESIAA